MEKALENCRKQAVDVARVEDYVVGKAAINPFKSDDRLRVIRNFVLVFHIAITEAFKLTVSLTFVLMQSIRKEMNSRL